MPAQDTAAFSPMRWSLEENKGIPTDVSYTSLVVTSVSLKHLAYLYGMTHTTRFIINPYLCLPGI